MAVLWAEGAVIRWKHGYSGRSDEPQKWWNWGQMWKTTVVHITWVYIKLFKAKIITLYCGVCSVRGCDAYDNRSSRDRKRRLESGGCARLFRTEGTTLTLWRLKSSGLQSNPHVSHTYKRKMCKEMQLKGNKLKRNSKNTQLTQKKATLRSSNHQNGVAPAGKQTHGPAARTAGPDTNPCTWAHKCRQRSQSHTTE